MSTLRPAEVNPGFRSRRNTRVNAANPKYASVLPPPFPFKLFVVSAGVFRLNLVRFTIAIAVGRTFRYLLEGYLAAHYGEHAKEILAHYYPSIGIGVAVLIIAFFIAKNLLKRGSQPEPVSSVES